MVIKILFFLLSFFFVLGTSSGQNIKFERISVKQGLSYSRVTCFLQDQTGFLWIGTQDGLNKYDGYNFTVFKHNSNDSTSISSHRIWSIFEDKDGFIWIGTLDGGLNKFDPGKQQFTCYINDPNNPNSLSHNTVTTISEDKMGFLWLGTLRGGLNKFNKKTEKFTRYQFNADNPNSLSNNSILTTCIDKSDILWVGTWGGGINRFDREKEQFVHYKNDPKNIRSLSSDIIWSIFADKTNSLWIGTMDGGLNKYNRTEESFICYTHDSKDINSISQNSINLIYEDSSGKLWIGTWGGGLDEFDPVTEKFKNYKHNSDDPCSLSHNEVKSIYEDKSGLIWIGTNGAGLNKLDLQKEKFAHFRHIPNSNSISNNDVWQIYSDKSGTIWIGTIGGGLNEFNYQEKSFINYMHDPDNSNSISHNSVISILEDRDGMLWIGTINGGLNKYNRVKKQFTRYFFDPENLYSISHNFIPSLYEDKWGKLWIGTWGGGLCLYEKKTDTFKRFQHNPNDNNSLSDNIIWAICEDRYGDFWVGTETGGLNKFDREGSVFKQYKHKSGDKESLSSNTVWSIYEDKKGRLWIGTAGGGLNKFNRKLESFVKYTTQDGLPNNMINGIVEDDQGYLWISTNKGLSKFNPEKEEFRNYDTDDGLQNNQFNFNAVGKRVNGELLFGGISGFNIFHPDSIKDNQNIPSIVITNFQLFNKPVLIEKNNVKEKKISFSLPKHISELKKIELSHNENVFSFEFAVLDYHSPQKNQYAYKLEGVDPDWVYTDATRRFATYTNLDPGEYIFKVKGSNNDGIWNEEGTSIKILITPPWWKTTWAYVLYILLFSGLYYFFRRYEMKRRLLKQQLEKEHFESEKLREVDSMKSHFFANISHEFRTPLTLIQGPAKQILSGEFKGNLKKQCQMILRNSNRLLTLVNQILELSRIESGKMKLKVSQTKIIPLIKSIVQSFESLANIKNINLRFRSNHDVLPGYMDRDKLEKIVINLLSNAFKFTPEGGVVEVEIKHPPNPLSKGEFTNSIAGQITSLPPGKGGLRGVLITISNSGPGIKEDQLAKIFDRFYQAENNYKKDSEGTGLGLALVKELVEVHHGWIKAESVINKYTSFIIYLPVTKEYFSEQEIYQDEAKLAVTNENNFTLLPEKQEVSIISSKNKDYKPLLLIIEDNADVTTFISNSLQDCFHIISAENGKIGMEKAIKKIPDIIISDVMMPEMDGFELCKSIKSDERTSHIPVILLTAKADFDSVITGLEFRADDYVTKPFDTKELRTRCKNLIEQRKKLRKKYSRVFDVNPQDISVTSADEKFLRRIVEIFEKNIDNPQYSTEEYASEIGMSRSGLNKKLHALTDLPTHGFILHLRLKRAAKLLREASGNVSEVAYRVGFNNTSHFAKAFRKQFNLSPSEFLKQNAAE